MQEKVLFARQPIFDRKQRVYAYELLFRDDDSDRANFIDGDLATRSVLLNAYSEHNAPQLLNGRAGYLNVGVQMFSVLPAFAREFMVVEVLECDHTQENLIDELKVLRERGFTVALDDFDMRNYRPELLEHVDIVKLDVLTYSEMELQRAIDTLSVHTVKLLAEKVETQAMFKTCFDMGFHLFQGYFFCRPEIVRGRVVDNNRQSIFELIQALYDPDADVNTITEIVKRDAVLSYKLLKLVNSSFYRRSQSVESIGHAVMMLGIIRIRSWATLVSLGSLNHKPDELQTESLIRAYMCEYLAQKLGDDMPPVAFAAGLLSCLDAWFDAPLTDLVSVLPLSETLNKAVIKKSGTLGELLSIVVKYMHTQWHDISDESLQSCQITMADLSLAYEYSVSRTDTVSTLMIEE